MGLVSSSIPNLLNGVSQQPAPLRQPTQAELQINGLSDVADGLKKRPNTEYTGNFPAGYNNGGEGNTAHNGWSVYMHEPTTFYEFFEWQGETKCFIAYYKPQETYLNSSYDNRPRTIYRIITLGKSETDVTTEDQFVTYLGMGGYSHLAQKEFTDTSSGSTYNQTSDYLFTDNPKRDIQLLITDTDILILNRSRIPESTSTLLGTLNSQLYNSFSDLPDGVGANAVVGNTYKIIGAATSAFDEYYVKALSTNTYEETYLPGEFGYVGVKMPMKVSYDYTNNGWEFDAVNYGDRTCGNSDSAPLPSFIGKRIESIFYFKNRLGILSGENVIFSEAGNFYNFFPKTVTTLLDDAPIDVSLKYTNGAALKHAVVFNDSLTIFSETKQFKVESNGNLTQSTISVVPSTEFDSNGDIKPVGAQNVLYFASTKGGFSSIKEYFIEADTIRSDATELTAHVPKYIPGDIKQLITAQSSDLILALTESGRVFVYKYFTDGEKKLQSSWSEWTFSTVNKIHAIYAIGDYIHFICATHSQPQGTNITNYHWNYSNLSLTTMVININPALDTVQAKTSNGTLEYITTLLDDKHTITTINNGGGISTRASLSNMKNMPSSATDKLVAINKATGEVLSTTSGLTQYGSFDIYFDSPLPVGTEVVVGFSYEFQYRLSPQYIRENNGTQAVQSGRLQLKSMRVGFEGTGYFKVEVTPINRATSTYEYTGQVINQLGSTVGLPSLSDGTFKFPVLSKNDSVTVDIKSDSFLPCAFQTIEWEGFYTILSKRI